MPDVLEVSSTTESSLLTKLLKFYLDKTSNKRVLLAKLGYIVPQRNKVSGN